MARRSIRRRARSEDGQPGWLLTYSDLMTLLLAFFVLLVSMSTIDERRRRMVIDSVFGGMGISLSGSGENTGDRLVPQTDPDAAHDARRDLGPLRAIVDDTPGKGVNFMENGNIQILSIDADVLFGPGEAHLTPAGERLLASIAPTLRGIAYPLLVAGHASPPRDEQGQGFRLRDPGTLSPSWMLSVSRATVVYRKLRELGLPASRLQLEGYGDLHPRHDDFTAAGRRANRRVDLVLDKRNLAWLQRRQGTARQGDYTYQGFRFDLDAPATPGVTAPVTGAPGLESPGMGSRGAEQGSAVPSGGDVQGDGKGAPRQLGTLPGGVSGRGEIRAPASGPTLVPVPAAPPRPDRFATPPAVSIPPAARPLGPIVPAGTPPPPGTADGPVKTDREPGRAGQAPLSPTPSTGGRP